ncbi:MAG: hypothetical protein PHY45_10410 [Rhodocyclaceae bacterium]|nr:hypothetical protein [Rhodocyclaceae bacterium]
MATEFIFFDAGLRDRFIQFAAARGIVGGVRADAIEGDVVELPDELGDEVAAALEIEYESLMDEQMALVEANEDADAPDVLGVDVTLPDGSACTVRLPPALARRLFDVFAPAEIHELVGAIAASVANPTTGPLCRKI